MQTAEKPVVLHPAVTAGIELITKMKKGEPVPNLDRLKAIVKVINSSRRDLNQDPEMALILQLADDIPQADQIQ